MVDYSVENIIQESFIIINSYKNKHSDFIIIIIIFTGNVS